MTGGVSGWLPLFSGLIGAVVVFFGMLAWECMGRKNAKLEMLAKDLSLLLDKIEAEIHTEKTPSIRMFREMSEVRKRLQSLGIRSPNINTLSSDCLGVWFVFLCSLVPVMEQGSLNEAREVPQKVNLPSEWWL